MIQRHLWAVLLLCFAGSCASAPKQDAFSKSTAWLEEVEGEKALNWVRAENLRTQTRLEADPRLAKFRGQFEKVLMAKDRIPFGWFEGSRIHNFWQDDKSVRGIWRRTTLDEYKKTKPSWETILDLDKLATTEKENWVFSNVHCLPPAEGRCLMSLSRGGKDADVLREFDLANKSFVSDGFILPEAKSSFSWWDENTILVGTDWGKGTLTRSGYPRQVRVWRRGQDYRRLPVLFEVKEEDLAAGALVYQRPEGQYVFVNRQIDFYSQEFFWVRPDFQELRKMPLPLDVDVIGLHKGQFIMSVRKPWIADTADGARAVASGEVVSFDFEAWLKNGKLTKVRTIFKATEQQAFQSLRQTASAVYVSYLENVQARVNELKWQEGEWTSTPVSVGDGLNMSLSTTSVYRDDMMLRVESFLAPTQLWYRGEKDTGFKTLRKMPDRFSAKGLQVEQLWATSADGTKIPYFSVGPKENKVTARPTVLSAYGGFEIPLTPYYSGGLGKVWMERGGRYIVANIRGGGEFGPRWHQAGIKENRPRVYEDFIAVAEDLIRRGLTTPKQLGIMGGSNGGLLVGVAFTKRPDLFAAVDCQVPLLDMMNYHRWLAGASWVGEYGDPEDSKMRQVLLSYSPLHNFHADRTYPEILFVTSTKDDRVHPAHARKMAYLMRESGKPFLYYENIEGGHGAAANLKQRAYKSALEFTYFSQKLGLP
ncbi:MAG: prolyl oligopeptidase family protein [Bdellovibrionales bacterium]